MIINLNELNIKDEILIDEQVFKNDRLDKRIYELENAFVKGKVCNDITGEIVLCCQFKGTMFIEDSISLEIIPYDFDMNILENLNDIKENYKESYDFSKNTLDLINVLWQNIVLEVPISYTKVIDANLKGNGWELKMQEESVGIDPRLKKLEDLLKGDD